jgi:Ni/Co efflux regulator RcnB
MICCFLKETEMKRLLTSLIAMTMVAGVPAMAAPSDFSYRQFAQRDDRRDAGPRGGGGQERGRGDNDRGRGGDNRGPGDDNRGRGRPEARPRVEHGPPNFERRAFQRNFDAPRRFRAGPFRAPPGWAYRRWGYGEILPRAYWAQPFWITNFWLYDLDRPPFGFEWVRSGPDALLIDTRTGEILRVEYNAFY